MIYPVLMYGNQSLRKKAEEIDENYENLQEIIKNLWETMYGADGIGFAAPQAGISIRIFVIDGAAIAKDYPELKNFKKVFINAKITEMNGEPVNQQEGCLSVPGIREDVTRPKRIRIVYYDENFKLHDEVFDDQRARIIQHEYDHIEGKLFIDHLSPLRKRLIKGKLSSIILGKTKVNYRVKLP